MINFSNNSVNINLSLLDNLQTHLAVINADGDIIKTNKAWENFGNDNNNIKRPQLRANYFSSLQKEVEFGNDYALKLLLGMKQVIQGKKELFSLVYPDTLNKSDVWYKASVLGASDSENFIIIHEDVSSEERFKNRQKSETNRYKVQFEKNILGVLITDDNGNILDVNPAACDMFGLEYNDLTSKTRGDLIEIKDDEFQEALLYEQENGMHYFETQIHHTLGYKIPVEISLNAYRMPNGKLRSIISLRDISRRKRTEQQLTKQKHFTESALESIPGIFLVMDSNYHIVRWNGNLLSHLGYTEEEITEKNALDFIVEDEKSKMAANIKKVMQGEELSLETKAVCKNGNVSDYFVFAKPFKEHGRKYIVATGIDITESKKVEKENRKNQKMLQQLFDHSPNGIIIADKDDRIRQVNQSFLRIFEYSKEELIGEKVNSLITPENKKHEAEAISLATHNGQILKVDTVRRSKYGKDIPVIVGSIPVSLQNENIAVYGIYMDITEQHLYQEKIKNTLREKEILLSELHHRVKNNLALINSLLELQGFETDNEKLISELEKIKGRILTIASIHEVLYKNDNLTNIPFDNYLNDFFHTGFINQQAIKKNIRLNAISTNCYMDIDQSIPSGLFLTEMLTLIFKYNDSSVETEIDVQLREYSDNMHLIVEGKNLLNCVKEVHDDSSMHRILVDTLVKQLNGTLLWPSPEKDHLQKFELIFKKGGKKNEAHNMLQNI